MVFALFKLPRRIRRAARIVGLSALLFTMGSASAGSLDDPQLFETIRQAELKVATIGWRLASGNVALCDRIDAGTGLQLHTLDQFDTASRDAAKAHFGFATPVAIEAVVAGSPAERAGLKADDSLVRIGTVDIAALPGKPMTTDRLVAAQLAIAALPVDTPMQVDVLRAGAPLRVTLQPIPICTSRFELRVANDWSASADGTMVQIGSRFVEEYPEEQLAAVMAHEFAHNVMRHREKLDARGVDFGMLSGFGKNVKYFRQTELQADILGAYLLNNAGYPVRSVIAFWQVFGPSKAGGFLRARSHPAWRDRIATLEAEIVKIEPVSARPVMPAILKDREVPLDGNWQALLIRAR